jgi:hypothetical protein
MKRWTAIVGVMAGASAFACALVVGCGTDDKNNSGKDATVLDVAYADTKASDAPQPDITQPPPPAYTTQVALAFCNRMQACCGAYDGGTFDYNACVAQTTTTGWMGTNSEFTAAVEQRMHVGIDMQSAQACVAGLAVLSCPTAGTAEVSLLTDQCKKALVGKQGSGANCIASIECTTGYCELDGGACAPAPEAGALLANNDPCTLGKQCASLLCVEPTSNYACDAGPCACGGLIDFRGNVCGLPPPPPPSDGGSDANDAD